MIHTDISYKYHYPLFTHQAFSSEASGMVSEKLMSSKHVCVIGAGPSGLVTARELRKEGHSVLVFEQNHDIGGQWLYESNVEDEDAMGKTIPLKVHSSVYDSLRLVTPREIMGFTDFPFIEKKGRDMRRFPGHKEMLLYLQDFCKWFQIKEMIRFSTRVEYVGMEDVSACDSDRRWVVRSKELETGLIAEEIFDAVVVANGHYSVPRLPIIKGMDSWTRKQLHSHVYRVPESFTNEILGFPYFESQAKWIAQLLSGKRTLPPWEEMMKAIKEYYQSKDLAGIPKHNTHDIASFEYCDKCEDQCEGWRKELCLSTLRNAEENLETYRDSWDDHELLQEAHQSFNFTQLD